MTTRPYVVLCIALLVSSSLSVAVAGSVPAVGASTEECQTVVEHTSFRTDDTKIEQLTNGSSATSERKNTRVTVQQEDGFYKVTGENPNGYCVHFIITASEEAIPPAELPGKVSANNKDIAATWDAIHSFEESETYTKITFTLPPGTDATFAPNEVRVVSVAWYSDTAEKSKSTWENVTGWSMGNDDNLTQNTYTLAPGEERRLVVPLRNRRTGEQISEWKALYRVPGSDKHTGWQKVDTDTSDPVYYTTVHNGSALAFEFQDPNAEVRFYANPGPLDSADYEMKGYLGGLQRIGDLLPDVSFTITPGFTPLTVTP